MVRGPKIRLNRSIERPLCFCHWAARISHAGVWRDSDGGDKHSEEVLRPRAGDRALAAPRNGSINTTHGVAASADLQHERVVARKLAEEKARARTLAKAQAVAEKLSSATDEVSSSIEEASGAIHELEKTMQQIATGSRQASAASEESRTAITEIEKSAQVATRPRPSPWTR